jgi:HEAT repeat protein
MQWFSSAQLKSKEPRRRIDALHRLAGVRDRQSISCVLSALGDPAVEVRQEALRIAVTWRDENTARALLHAIRDSQPEIRERAISDLGALGLRDGIPAILPCLCDVAMPVRAAAVQALHMLGWMPANAAERALESVGRSQFGKAAALGRDALELLLPFAGHAAADTRRSVASALGLIREPEAIAGLHRLMTDVDAGVRIAALTAMANVEPTVSVIAPAVSDPDKNVRIAAVEVLGEMRNSEAVPCLSNCLRDQHWEVRCAAAAALALLGERSTIPLLVQGLRDVDPDMRVAAAEALAKVADAESIEPLIAAYLDPETNVRQAALRALVRVDYRWHRNARAYQSLPSLKRALRSQDYAVRNAATELMERIFSIRRPSLRSSTGDPEVDRCTHAVDLLITCLWDDDPLLRGAAAEGLGTLRSSRARDALKVAATDSHQWVQQAATRALDLVENSRGSLENGWRPGLRGQGKQV